MCGIVGVAARRDVVPTLIHGLKALEYRGYDSAGIALLTPSGMQRLRAKGKVAELEALHAATPIAGHTGIAHTRWATHGVPAERNAHPMLSNDTVAVVHNGIIENHAELREELRGKGYAFTSDTDTATWQLSCLPSTLQYCRATPTECFPFFGIAVSSNTHAPTGA